jgi:hypothetical protein
VTRTIGLKPRSFCASLRGAQAPLFRGAATVRQLGFRREHHCVRLRAFAGLRSSLRSSRIPVLACPTSLPANWLPPALCADGASSPFGLFASGDVFGAAGSRALSMPMGDWMGVAVRGTRRDDDHAKLKGLGPENNDGVLRCDCLRISFYTMNPSQLSDFAD